eukprot:UN04444
MIKNYKGPNNNNSKYPNNNKSRQQTSDDTTEKDKKPLKKTSKGYAEFNTKLQLKRQAEAASFSFANDKMRELYTKPPEDLKPAQFYQLAKVVPPSLLTAHLDWAQTVGINNLFDGKTSLIHSAANSKKVDLVRELLSRGAHVNLQDSVGDTPLHVAVRTGDPYNCT